MTQTVTHKGHRIAAHTIPVTDAEEGDAVHIAGRRVAGHSL